MYIREIIGVVMLLVGLIISVIWAQSKGVDALNHLSFWVFILIGAFGLVTLYPTLRADRRFV